MTTNGAGEGAAGTGTLSGHIPRWLIVLCWLRVAGLAFGLAYLGTHLGAIRYDVIVRDNHRAETHQQIVLANVAITIDVVIGLAVIVGYLLIIRGLAARRPWAPKTLIVVSAIQILVAVTPRANPFPLWVKLVAFAGALLCIATFLLLLLPAAGRQLILDQTPGSITSKSSNGHADSEQSGLSKGLIPRWATFPLTLLVILLITPAVSHAPLWGQLLTWAVLLGFAGLAIWYRIHLNRNRHRRDRDPYP